MIARARAARLAGLDSLFVGDHHSRATGYLQNSPILGRMLAEWHDRPAGALYLLPLWNPVLVAEQVSTLAAIAPGPFVMQCAVGDGEDQFGAMGARPATRGRVFEAALPVIQALLRGETVSSETLGISSASIGRAPESPVTVWIGGHSPAAIDRAARLGDGWIAGPELGEEEAAGLAALYLERCEHHRSDPGVVALRRDIHVAATSQQGRSVVDEAVRRGYRGMDPAVLVHGTTDEVATRLGAFGDVGYTDVLVRHIADDHEAVMGSYERLADVRAAIA
jgi:alkanesulfonate monooxygenase SsuD/methylene tetrahydromethanopterin reductase-like flavin-dependent oxidoreductase (luciferase family)